MKIAVVRLVVAAVLFVGWIGYLSFLAVTSRNPIVLSRPQFLVSQRDVIATYKGEDKFSMDEILYPSTATDADKNKILLVRNLKDCQTFTPQNGWQAAPLAEGARYLLPLQSPAGTAPAPVDEQDVMDVVPTPTSAALAGPPHIYPDTPEVRQQYQALQKP